MNEPPVPIEPSNEITSQDLKELAKSGFAAWQHAASEQTQQHRDQYNFRLEALRLSLDQRRYELKHFFPLLWVIVLTLVGFVVGAFVIRRPDLAFSAITFVFGWFGGAAYTQGRQRQDATAQTTEHKTSE